MPDDPHESENDRSGGDDAPDVFLDVPLLKVDEIDLEVEDLRAHVSLQAEVLDLLKLNVGVDATLGRVQLNIKGVEAQAQLRVRLDEVGSIIARVLDSVDRNPQILEQVTRGVGQAASDLGRGVGDAVDQVGEGAGEAVREVGQGARGATQQLGRSVGGAVEDVGEGAGSATETVGRGAGRTVEEVGSSTGDAVGSVTRTAGDVGRAARDAVGAGDDEDAGDSTDAGSDSASGQEEDADQQDDQQGPAATSSRASRERAAANPAPRVGGPQRLGIEPDAVGGPGRSPGVGHGAPYRHPASPGVRHDDEVEDAGRERRSMSDDGPISFRSSVRADEMTFHDVRDDEVTFHGDAGPGSWAGTRREGLPDDVTPGVTYRQVQVDFRIATELEPDER